MTAQVDLSFLFESAISNVCLLDSILANLTDFVLDASFLRITPTLPLNCNFGGPLFPVSIPRIDLVNSVSFKLYSNNQYRMKVKHGLIPGRCNNCPM